MDPSQEAGSPPATRTPESEAQEILASALGGSHQPPGPGGQPPGTDPSKGAGSPVGPAPLTGKVLVDWNGATREVDIDQLVKNEIERGPVEQLREAQQSELQKLGQLQALDGVYSQWSPAQQQQFQAIIQNPSLLDQPPSNPQRQPNGHADDQGNMDTDSPSIPGHPGSPAVDPSIGRLNEAMGYVLKRLESQDQTVARSSREEDVTGKLGGFSVFKAHPGALTSAREQVMDHLTAHPEVEVEQAVAKIASYTQEMMQASGARSPGPFAEPGDAQNPRPQIRLDGAQIARQMESGEAVSTGQRIFESYLGARPLGG